jgi:threonine dehydrogenase-like Zn-dependent dehydrogenase
VAAVAAATRAAVVAAPGLIRSTAVSMPDPAADEVLVRVEGSGVCGSNVPLWEGRPWFQYPLPAGAPGHEGWGVVEETGQRVCFLSDRAFAEHALVKREQLVLLPAELDGEPVPGEALGCAMNVFRRSGIVAGERVAVVGIGFLGALLVQLAARAGGEVVALARKPFARERARHLGAAVAVEETDDDFDCVVEAAGAQATLDAAAALVRTRGRLVVAGFHQDGRRTVDMQSWNWRGIDVVNAHERDPAAYVEGMQLAIDALLTGFLDPTPLYTHRFPLERLGDALETARRRPDGFVKALVLT